MHFKNGGGDHDPWLRIPKVRAVYFAGFFPTRVNLINPIQKIVFNWD
jgi:hypothetical protein